MFYSLISKCETRNAHLESDVVELAAVADGRSAGMDHAVHVHDRRAALRTFAGSLPGGAARRGAAAVGAFASGSLLARHLDVSRIWMPPTVERSSPKSTQQPKSVTTTITTTTTYEQKGGNNEKVAAVEKGKEERKFSCAGLWSCASDASSCRRSSGAASCS